jgi:hypothetical protein
MAAGVQNIDAYSGMLAQLTTSLGDNKREIESELKSPGPRNCLGTVFLLSDRSPDFFDPRIRSC